MSDDITAMFRALFGSFKSKSAPLGARVANTKMTHTRLKALETPDYLKDKHALAAAQEQAPETTEFQICSTEEEVSKRVRSLADMSQYRLAALKSVLKPEEQEDLPHTSGKND